MSFIQQLLLGIPFECAICKRWPSASFEGVTGVCQSCIQTHAKAPLFPVPLGLDDCAAAVDFDVPWSALISRYKFAPEPGLAKFFSGLMLRNEKIHTLIDNADIVIPLPLSTERLEERGFNQAFTLAKHLAIKKVNASVLIKTRDTVPQRLLDRKARQRNVANAFALHAISSKAYRSTNSSLSGKHVLLIDDVMTTGATLAAAAQPLYKAGAVRISAIVIAHTPLN